MSDLQGTRVVASAATVLVSSTVLDINADFGFTADELNGVVPKGSSSANFGIFESFIEDGSYFKLREVALTYNLKLDKSYLDNVKFTLSGTNLISIDNYYGFDPEVNTESQSNGSRGQDMANVPIPQVFKLGVIFNF